MARPYHPGPKQFVFGAGDGDDRQVSVDDPQEAYVAFSAFYRGRESDTCSVDDEQAGQRLVLMPGRGVIARSEATGRARSEYLTVDGPHRYLPSAMLFFENGFAGLDRFGQWLPELADLDASPEARGAARAAAVTTVAEAIEHVGRIWGDSGTVDRSDQFYVFFDAHALDEDPAERAELLGLITFLGLQRVDAPAGSADGEVWVRTDERLDVELAKWS